MYRYRLEYIKDADKRQILMVEHEHILTGLIRCPLCGGGMRGTVQRRQNKKTGEYKDTFYYRCHHRKKVDGKICDYKPMLNQKMFNAEVEEFIRYMVAGDEFRKFVQEKLEEKVDVSALKTEREQLQKQLKQVQGSKLKLIQMLPVLCAFPLFSRKTGSVLLFPLWKM